MYVVWYNNDQGSFPYGELRNGNAVCFLRRTYHTLKYNLNTRMARDGKELIQ